MIGNYQCQIFLFRHEVQGVTFFHPQFNLFHWAIYATLSLLEKREDKIIMTSVKLLKNSLKPGGSLSSYFLTYNLAPKRLPTHIPQSLLSHDSFQLLPIPFQSSPDQQLMSLHPQGFDL